MCTFVTCTHCVNVYMYILHKGRNDKTVMCTSAHHRFVISPPWFHQGGPQGAHFHYFTHFECVLYNFMSSGRSRGPPTPSQREGPAASHPLGKEGGPPSLLRAAALSLPLGR